MRERASGLRVEELVVRFGGVAAVDGVELAVAEREVVCVLGPSGCGKTTLLRAIAGLEPASGGRVSWGGAVLAAVAPHRRGFGMVFQDFALFPHRDVFGNVAFGLRMSGADRAAQKARVDEVLALVGLDGYGARSVATLSGGEQQRVALARALAPRPRLLLLDEPLGSLDRALRQRLVVDLRELLTAADVSAVYVTHDQEEAFALADSLVVMRAGRVVQRGAPEAVWSRPADEFVARFLGFENVVDGRVIRPDAFRPTTDGDVRGVVVSRTYRGDHFVVRVATDGDGPVLAVAARWTPPPAVGERVTLALDPAGVIPLGGDSAGGA
jgi:thiamine transport system ATP-binding protein